MDVVKVDDVAVVPVVPVVGVLVELNSFKPKTPNTIYTR